jgi:hypothetical protein
VPMAISSLTQLTHWLTGHCARTILPRQLKADCHQLAHTARSLANWSLCTCCIAQTAQGRLSSARSHSLLTGQLVIVHVLYCPDKPRQIACANVECGWLAQHAIWAYVSRQGERCSIINVAHPNGERLLEAENVNGPDTALASQFGQRMQWPLSAVHEPAACSPHSRASICMAKTQLSLFGQSLAQSLPAEAPAEAPLCATCH